MLGQRTPDLRLNLTGVHPRLLLNLLAGSSAAENRQVAERRLKRSKPEVRDARILTSMLGCEFSRTNWSICAQRQCPKQDMVSPSHVLRNQCLTRKVDAEIPDVRFRKILGAPVDRRRR